MAMVQAVTDNFTRANASPLGGNWSIPTFGGNGGNQIVSNTCEPTVATGVNCTSYWSAAIPAPGGIFPNDQYAEVTVFSLVSSSGASNYVQSYTRISNGASGLNAYRFQIGFENTVANYYIEKFVNGVNSTLIGPVATTINVGDIFRIQIIGTTITVFRNGVQINTTTDASLASGQPGLAQNVSNGGAVVNSRISLFAAGANQCATPTFSPVAGVYSGTQLVAITSATGGCTIFYTTDGSTPTESSLSVANGGTVSVSSSLTLKAIASLTNNLDSAVASAAYTITGGFVAYSVPDSRAVTATTPNSSRTVNGTLIYDVPKVDSRAAGAPVDSRAAGAPIASNVSYPQNSRTPGTFGPGE